MNEKEERLTAEEVREMLSQTEKGVVRQTLQNCVTALGFDPVLGQAIRYNEFTGQWNITEKMPWERQGSGFTDTDFNQICLDLENRYQLTRDRQIRQAADIICHRNRYHPVRDLLNSLTWDGVERIRELLPKYLGAERSEYVYEATLLMMLGAICRVFSPGCKFEYMLCIVGRQGAGKSTLFRFLSLCDEWFSDDLRRIEDDNVYRKLQGHWFIEMPEMIATATAKNIEEIKAFISRQKETCKVPYAVYPQDIPRQCVFVGTSNSTSFLPFDRSDNRRFLPVLLRDDLPAVHPLADENECRDFIRKCWAEAMAIYRSGDYQLVLPHSLETEVRRLQQEFMPEDTKAGMVQAWLSQTREEYVCSRMIYEKAFHREGQRLSSLRPPAVRLQKHLSGIRSRQKIRRKCKQKL